MYLIVSVHAQVAIAILCEDTVTYVAVYMILHKWKVIFL